MIDFVSANAAAGPLVLTLPSAVGRAGDLPRTIKKTDLSINTVSIVAFGSETIDGAPSHWLVFYGQYVTVVSDNTNWHVIATNYIGAELGHCEAWVRQTTSNNYAVAAPLLGSNLINFTLVAMACTTVGTGRPVKVAFKCNMTNGSAFYFTAATILMNGQPIDTAMLATPTGAEYGTINLTTNPILAAGVSYSFEIGAWCQSTSLGVYYGDTTTPIPNTLTVTGA